MRASDIMNRNVITTGPETPVSVASERMAYHRIGALPVVDRDGKLLGVLSAADVVWAHAHELPRGDVSTEGPEPVEPAAPEAAKYWYHLGLAEARRRMWDHEESDAELLVSEVYSPGAITVTPDTPIGEVAGLMSRHRLHHLVVCDGGRLCGVISALDLVRASARQLPDAA